jgi:hypothetical protein
LQPRDQASRVRFCSWLLQSTVEGEIDMQLTFFCDEEWFHLQGYINTQNHYWGSQYPYLTHEVQLHAVKVGVWCAVSARLLYLCFVKKQLIARDIYVYRGTSCDL